MATYQPEAIDLDGVAPTFRAAANGDTFPPGSGVFVCVRTSGTASTVELVTPENVDGDLAVPNRFVTLPATGERHIAVPSRYADTVTGLATINFSSLVGVTYSVEKI